jgi:flagellar hook-basal body complex protein FliE
MATELDDVRQRLDAIGRDAARTSEKMLDAVLDRVATQQKSADKHLAERLDREFSGIHERMAELRDRAEQLAADDDQLDGLRGEFERLESRMREVESSTGSLVAEISDTVFARLAERDGVLAGSQSTADTAHAESIERLERRIGERLTEESAEIARVMDTLGSRVAAIDERTGNAVEAVAERVAERVVIDESALTDAVARVASRVDSRIDEIMEAVLRSDNQRAADVTALRKDIHVAAADRTALDEALAHSAERADERLDRALTDLRGEFTARQDEIVSVLTEGVGRLDGQVAALAERSTAADESLAAAMSDGFGPALESALSTALTAALGNAMDGVREEIESLRRSAAESRSAAPEVIGEMLESALSGVHREMAEIATRTVATEASLAATFDGAVTGLRTELEALAQHQAARAERQDEAIQALRDEIAAQAVAQSEAASRGFEGALDEALDKITRTMESATARPIEISVEATDVLLDKLFDASDSEMSTNLGQLDVKESTSRKGIKGSLGKLRALRGTNSNAKTGTE